MTKTVVVPVTGGFKYTGEAESSGFAWLLFRAKDVASLTDSELIADMGFHTYYTGPGMPFRDLAHVRRGRNRVLLTQFRGRDI